MPPKTTKTEGTTTRKSDAKAKEEENKRYLEGVADCVSKFYVFNFPTINKSVSENISTRMYKFILTHIHHLQNTEVKNNQYPDTYPNDKYYDLNSQDAKKTVSKRKVKTTGDDKPVKETIPNRILDEEETAEEQEEQEEQHEEEEQTDPIEETEEVKPAEEAKATKKHLARMDRTAKTWFGFIMNRYLTEYYNLAKHSNSPNPDEFVKFTCTANNKKYASRLTRSVVLSCERLYKSIEHVNDHGLGNYLQTTIESVFSQLKDNKNERIIVPHLISHMARYLSTYFRLIGVVLADLLWTQTFSTSVKGSHIEYAMRILDYGNLQYALDKGYIPNSESFMGLSTGILTYGRYYQEVTLPIVVKRPPPVRPPTKRGKKATEEVKTEETKTEESEEVHIEEQEEEEEVKPKANGKATNGKTANGKTNGKPVKETVVETEEEPADEPQPEPPKTKVRQLKAAK